MTYNLLPLLTDWWVSQEQKRAKIYIIQSKLWLSSRSFVNWVIWRRLKDVVRWGTADIKSFNVHIAASKTSSKATFLCGFIRLYRSKMVKKCVQITCFAIFGKRWISIQRLFFISSYIFYSNPSISKACRGSNYYQSKLQIAESTTKANFFLDIPWCMSIWALKSNQLFCATLVIINVQLNLVFGVVQQWRHNLSSHGF